MNFQKMMNKYLGFLDNKNTLFSFANSVLIFLVIYSALFVDYMPKIFISFIDTILGKIIMILLIIIIGMKSRAIALLLALAFVITLQRAQMLRMSGNLVELKVLEKLNNKQEEEEEEEHNKVNEPFNNGDHELESGVAQTTESAGQRKEEFQNFMGSLFAESSKEKPVNMILGYNSNTDCSMNCGKNIDGQCSPVETYNSEYDPQGLNCMSNVGGYVDSVGYPF